MTTGCLRYLIASVQTFLCTAYAGADAVGNVEADSSLIAFTALDEVVVTATRTPKALKDVPVVTRVISADDISKTDATNITDLLTQELPGLEFGFSMSQETSLSMGGFGGNAVLFLVDGERLAGETLDNVDYNRLDLGNVGQVEIVKGASSALYGANAVGGVVNLISRESGEPFHASVSSRFRSAGKEWRTAGSLNFNSRKWHSNTSVQHVASQTIRLTDAFDTRSKIHNIFGGSSLNVRERLVFRAAENLRLTARGGFFRRVSDRSNYADHYDDLNGGLKAVWNITPDRNLELSYGFDRYDKSRYTSGVRTHDHDYRNRQHTLHGLYSMLIGKAAVTLGADWMDDRLSTYQFTDNASHSQTSLDAFVQADFNPLTWLNVVASVREDYFSASGHLAFTTRLATLLKLKPMSVRLSYSGGFRAPTLKEMYMNFDMAGIQMIYGNPGLKPERSHNFCLSLERNGHVCSGPAEGAYSLTAAGYYNYYDSRITTTDYPGDDSREAGAIYTNEDGVRVMSLDIGARYNTRSGVRLSASYNFMHVAGGSVDSQFSQPRPHSATWSLGYDRRIGRNYSLWASVSGRWLETEKRFRHRRRLFDVETHPAKPILRRCEHQSHRGQSFQLHAPSLLLELRAHHGNHMDGGHFARH